MAFDNPGILELVFALLLWGLPLVLLAWFIRTLSGMAISLREVADNLASLDRAVRDSLPHRPPPTPL